jgi:DNA polymerase III alpha subunit
MQVKGLRRETIEAIIRARLEGPHRSLEDFLERVPIPMLRDEIESLIKCGALDDLGVTRPALLWQLNLALRPASGGRTKSPPAPHQELPFPEAATPACRTGRPELAALPVPSAPLPSASLGTSRASVVGLPAACGDPEASGRTMSGLPALAGFATDYTREQRLAYEQQILEVCVTGHPLDLAQRNGEIWSTDLEKHRGRHVRLLGWLVTFRHVGTKNYRNMMFATFEDQRGIYEVVLFPEAYERYGGLVFETRMLRVTGRVEPDGQINCQKLEPVQRA